MASSSVCIFFHTLYRDWKREEISFLRVGRRGSEKKKKKKGKGPRGKGDAYLLQIAKKALAATARKMLLCIACGEEMGKKYGNAAEEGKKRNEMMMITAEEERKKDLCIARGARKWFSVQQLGNQTHLGLLFSSSFFFRRGRAAAASKYETQSNVLRRDYYLPLWLPLRARIRWRRKTKTISLFSEFTCPALGENSPTLFEALISNNEPISLIYYIFLAPRRSVWFYGLLCTSTGERGAWDSASLFLRLSSQTLCALT